MRIFLAVAIISCIFFACKPKGPSEYYWFSVRESKRTDSVKLISSKKTTVKDTVKLEYTFDWGSINYSVAGSKEGSYVVLHPNKKTEPGIDSISHMQYLKDTTVTVGSDSYKVTKYILTDKTGQVTQCYEPEVGMYAFYNESRPGIVYLQSNDSTFNARIKGLVRVTVPSILATAKYYAY